MSLTGVATFNPAEANLLLEFEDTCLPFVGFQRSLLNVPYRRDILFVVS